MVHHSRSNRPPARVARSPGPSIARGRATTSGLGGNNGKSTPSGAGHRWVRRTERMRAPPPRHAPHRRTGDPRARSGQNPPVDRRPGSPHSSATLSAARSPCACGCGTAARRALLAAPVVVLRSRKALRRLLWNPDELGLARAYVAGEIDVDGDLAEGLSRAWVSSSRTTFRHARACGTGCAGPARRSASASWAPAPPPRRRRRCSTARSTAPAGTATRSATTTTRATICTRRCLTSTWPTRAPTSAPTRPPIPVPPTARTPSPRRSGTSWN